MRFFRVSLLALLVPFGALLVPVTSAAFAVPVNDGLYTQTTPVLTEAQEQDLERILTEEERASGNQIAVLVVESLEDEPIEDAANLVFRTWGIGQKDRNNGILILVASADHKIRIEVGYGLEGAVPDLVAKGIIDNDIAPEFREAKYYEGLLAGVDALRKHVAGEYTAERYEGDGGAPDFVPFLFFFFFIFVNFFGAVMARSKSWWLGGIVGGVCGIILAAVFSWWIAIPILAGIGAFFDYIVSMHPEKFRRGGRGGFWGGGFGGGSGSGGGGFGGFGGGSSGGGGASGGW